MKKLLVLPLLFSSLISSINSGTGDGCTTDKNNMHVAIAKKDYHESKLELDLYYLKYTYSIFSFSLNEKFKDEEILSLKITYKQCKLQALGVCLISSGWFDTTLSPEKNLSISTLNIKTVGETEEANRAIYNANNAVDSNLTAREWKLSSADKFYNNPYYFIMDKILTYKEIVIEVELSQSGTIEECTTPGSGEDLDDIIGKLQRIFNWIQDNKEGITAIIFIIIGLSLISPLMVILKIIWKPIKGTFSGLKRAANILGG